MKVQKQFLQEMAEIMQDIEATRAEITKKQKEVTAKQRALAKLRKEAAKFKGGLGIKITDHAIVRYLQRVKGLDIEEIEREILNPKITNLVEKLGGSGQYPADGFSAVLKDFHVVSILTPRIKTKK